MIALTPEHMQLLSDKRLEETALNADTASGAATDEAQRQDRQAMARAARYELARRRCEVPVRDRYGN